MASTAGNCMFVVTQYIPGVNPYPVPQGTHMAQTPGFLHRFIKGEPKALGVVQIMIGIIHILLGGILCFLQIPPIVVFSGVVFWGSIFFIISGGLAISAENKGVPCLVKGSLGMNIVSTIAGVIGLAISIIDCIIWRSSTSDCYQNYYSYYDYSSDYVTTCNTKIMRNGILVVLLIFFCLEICISLATSVFGCRSVCKHDSLQAAAQPLFVVQNTSPQDPRLITTQTAGIPMGQGMTVAQGLSIPQGATTTQGIPMGQGTPIMPGIPFALGVQSTPLPTTEPPPSYYKNVHDEGLQNFPGKE